MAHSPTRAPVAVVGAGMAGLACARRLAESGVPVTVTEKSRGLGGRMASRRDGQATVDHGAQYFRARDPAFKAEVEQWLAAGAVEAWQPRLADYRPGGRVFVADTQPRYVGTPAMNAPLHALAPALEIVRQTRIKALSATGDGWRLETETGPLPGSYAQVVLALPAPQALPLLEAVPTLAHQVAGVSMTPCWAVMAGFGRPLDLDFDAARFQRGAVAWACRDSHKPHRAGEREHWVLHADADWSGGHLEQAPGAVKRVLLDAFFAQIERPTRWPQTLQCNLWRYARSRTPLREGSLYESHTGIGVCGDWLRGRSNVENAYLSGRELAERILGG